MRETARPNIPWASPKVPYGLAEGPLLKLSHVKNIAGEIVKCNRHDSMLPGQGKQASKASKYGKPQGKWRE
jgi:hypothetical protein